MARQTRPTSSLATTDRPTHDNHHKT